MVAVVPYVLEVPCSSYRPFSLPFSLSLSLLLRRDLSVSPLSSPSTTDPFRATRIYEGVRNRTSVYTEQELKEDGGQDEGFQAEQRVQV